MRRAKAKRNTSYVTKRVFRTAVVTATRNASDNAMRSMGYIVKAENGWVIRENADGSKRRISKIKPAHQAIALD